MLGFRHVRYGSQLPPSPRLLSMQKHRRDPICKQRKVPRRREVRSKQQPIFTDGCGTT